MILERPYQKVPYDDMVAMGCPWIGDFKSSVEEEIRRKMEELDKEAAYDGEPRLTSEDYLYERFKDNCYYGLFRANWQVLKYFYRLFQIKIYKDMIGEWTFTDHDKEMYEYFCYTPFDENNKCFPRYIRLNTIEKEREWYDFWTEYHPDKIEIYYVERVFSTYSGSILYTGLFGNMFTYADDMITNSRRKPRVIVTDKQYNFFNTKKLHMVGNHCSYGELYKVDFKEIDIAMLQRSVSEDARNTDTTVQDLENNQYFASCKKALLTFLDETVSNYREHLAKLEAAATLVCKKKPVECTATASWYINTLIKEHQAKLGCSL